MLQLCLGLGPVSRSQKASIDVYRQLAIMMMLQKSMSGLPPHDSLLHTAARQMPVLVVTVIYIVYYLVWLMISSRRTRRILRPSVAQI